MIVGLTGRAGVGKSLAAEILARLYGFDLIDLDAIGHRVLGEDESQLAIVERFGAGVLGPGGVDRKKLGGIVFSDSEALKDLNGIMHPRMKLIVEAGVLSDGGTDYLIEGALLKEIGLLDLCDQVLVLDASDAHILEYAGVERLKIAQLQRTRDAFLGDGGICVLNDGDVVKLEKRLLDLELFE